MISSSERSLPSFASPCRYHSFLKNKRSAVSFFLSSSLVISFESSFIRKSSSSNVRHFDETFVVIPSFPFFFLLLSSERPQDILCCFFLSFFVRMNVVKTFVVVPSFSFRRRMIVVNTFFVVSSFSFILRMNVVETFVVVIPSFSFLPNDRRRIVRLFFFFFFWTISIESLVYSFFIFFRLLIIIIVKDSSRIVRLFFLDILSSSFSSYCERLW